MDVAEQKEQQAGAIAYKILSLAKDSVLSEYPFLERAAARLVPAVNDTYRFAGSGSLLLFDPLYLFTLFRQSQCLVNRAWLHTLLHRLLCHNLVGKSINRPLWNLACDVAVENIMNELNAACLVSPEAETERGFTDALKEKGIRLTAEQLYRAFRDSRMTAEQAQEIREHFFADQHSLWYEQDQRAGETAKTDLSMDWKALAEKVEMQMGEGGGREALSQNLHELCRSGRQYTNFLRRFGRNREVMRLSMDEYDRNYYSFGMAHYGNIPLIEPLEYSDRNRLRDLVIAIDTSGSVKGELVQRFIQHSYDILMGSEQFQDRFSVRILQCDDRIQEDVVLHTREEFGRYAQRLTVKGLGGTDFRPVFTLIRNEIEAGNLARDCGLLYFTDGEGTYPENQPDWDTVFVLFGNLWKTLQIPEWAESLVLREEDILDGQL